MYLIDKENTELYERRVRLESLRQKEQGERNTELRKRSETMLN